MHALKRLVGAILLLGCCWSAYSAPAPTPASPENTELGDAANLPPAFGQAAQQVPNDLLDGVEPDDLSWIMIQRLFGDPAVSVDNFFFDGGGGGSSVGTATVLTNVIRILGYIALLFGLGVTGYTLIVGLIKTTQSGEWLGKWDSAFLPARVGAAFISIIPLPVLGGFSLVQGIVLAVALAGISAASSTANLVYDLVLTQPLTITPPNGNGAANTAASMVKAQVCGLLREKQRLASPGATPNSLAGLIPDYDVENLDTVIGNGFSYERATLENSGHRLTKIAIGEDGDCGSMQFTFPAGFAQGSTEDQVARQMFRVHRVGLDELWSTLMQAVSIPIVRDEMTSAAAYELARAEFAEAVDRYHRFQQAESAAMLAATQAEALAEVQDTIKRGGWVMMGGYYWLIEARQQRMASAFDVSLAPFTAFEGNYEIPGQEAEVMAALAAVNSVVNRQISPRNLLSDMRRTASGSQTSDVFNEGSPSGWYENTTNFITKTINEFVVDGLNKMSGGQTGPDGASGYFSPMLVMRTTGTGLMDAVMVIGGASAIISWAKDDDNESSSGGTGSAILTSMVMLAMAAGVLLGFVIPSLPFIMWLVATAMHMLYVVEALIWSPFWGSMHMAPDGNEIAGRGSSGYPIAATLFLKPLLMVVGFVAGMSLLHVVGWLIHEYVIEAYILTRVGSFGNPLSLIMPLLIYALLMMYITYRFLALTHELPDAILRAMGVGDHHNLGEGDVKNQVVAVGNMVPGVLGGMRGKK